MLSCSGGPPNSARTTGSPPTSPRRSAASPSTPSASPASSSPGGALNVAGVTPEGDLVNYWWVPGFDAWIITSITGAAAEASPERLAGALTGVGSPDGVASIIGESADGDVIRYLWQPGDGPVWHTENVTAIATPLP